MPGASFCRECGTAVPEESVDQNPTREYVRAYDPSGYTPTTITSKGIAVPGGLCSDETPPELQGFAGDHARELAGEATVTRLEDRALLALQGPEAAAVLAAHVPDAAQMVFMDAQALTAFRDPAAARNAAE